MRSWTGLLIGALGLAVLDAVLQNQGGAGRVGSFLEGAGGLVQRFLDPAVPFFSTTTSSGSSSSSSSSTTIPGGTTPATTAPSTPPAITPSTP